MISLTPVIDRLRTASVGRAKLPAQLPWFRQVEGAAAFARVASLPQVPLPGCWVVRAAEQSAPAGERRSVVTVAFDVVIGITNHRIASAGDSDDVLLAYRLAVLAELQELRDLPGLVDAIERKGGSVIEYAEGDLWWRDQYTCAVAVTNYLPDPPAFDRITNTNP